MPRYKLTIEYDGSGFVGWQRQDNGVSVQQALEEAIAGFSGQAVTAYAAGRTDAGVHALGQVVHIDLDGFLQRLLHGDAMGMSGGQPAPERAPTRFIVAEAALRSMGVKVNIEMRLRHVDSGDRWCILFHLDQCPVLVMRGLSPSIRSGQWKRNGRSNSSSALEKARLSTIRPIPPPAGGHPQAVVL